MRNNPLPDSAIRDLIARTRDESRSPADRLESRNTILLSNTGWRIQLANRYISHFHRSTIEAADLEHDGLIGEMHAIETFDLDMGTRYVTYATIWILNGIRSTLRNFGDTVRRPIWIQEADENLKRTASRLRCTEEEAAEYLGLKPLVVRYIRQARAHTYSVNAVWCHEDDLNPHDLPDPHSSVPQFELDEERIATERCVQGALDRLSDRDRRIVEMRMEGRKLWFIGKALKLSRERVRQIERAAHRKMRIWMEG